MTNDELRVKSNESYIRHSSFVTFRCGAARARSADAPSAGASLAPADRVTAAAHRADAVRGSVNCFRPRALAAAPASVGLLESSVPVSGEAPDLSALVSDAEQVPCVSARKR